MMQMADSVAQLVEHLPFKERVLGSNPSRVTILKNLQFTEGFFMPKINLIGAFIKSYLFVQKNS